jgi:hypothetical protein
MTPPSSWILGIAQWIQCYKRERILVGGLRILNGLAWITACLIFPLRLFLRSWKKRRALLSIRFVRLQTRRLNRRLVASIDGFLVEHGGLREVFVCLTTAGARLSLAMKKILSWIKANG